MYQRRTGHKGRQRIKGRLSDIYNDILNYLVYVIKTRWSAIVTYRILNTEVTKKNKNIVVLGNIIMNHCIIGSICERIIYVGNNFCRCCSVKK